MMSNHQSDRQHNAIRVLVVDDQKMMQELIGDYIRATADLELVAVASDGREGVQQALALKPDVVLMDIEMPEMDGIAATQILKNRKSSAKVLVVSSSYDDRYLAQSLRNGAMGYLLKTATPDELMTAIRGVHSGNLQFGSGILRQKLSSMTPGDNTTSLRPTVPPRQSSARERSVAPLDPSNSADTTPRSTSSRSQSHSSEERQRSSRTSRRSESGSPSVGGRQSSPTVTIDVDATAGGSTRRVNNINGHANATLEKLAIELSQIRAGYWVLRTEIQAQRRWLNRLSLGLAISIAVSCLFAFF
ncbi:MAG: response regulator transcription factor [Cyanobacteria bacterium P01_E01_bin.34]